MHCITAVNSHGTPVSSMHCNGTVQLFPHVHQDLVWARPSLLVTICTGTGRTPALICTRAWLIPPTSAPGLNAAPHAVGRSRERQRWTRVACWRECCSTDLSRWYLARCRDLRRDWAGPRPQLPCDWAHPSHICTWTQLAPAHGRISCATATQQDWVHPVPRSYGDTARPWSMFNDDWAHPSHIIRD
jgi:hypothetical protein